MTTFVEPRRQLDDPATIYALLDEQMERVEFYSASMRAFCGVGDIAGVRYSFSKMLAHIRMAASLRDDLPKEAGQ